MPREHGKVATSSRSERYRARSGCTKAGWWANVHRGPQTESGAGLQQYTAARECHYFFVGRKPATLFYLRLVKLWHRIRTKTNQIKTFSSSEAQYQHVSQ